MKIILLQNIGKLGKKGDIKNVSDGYGKNFLIARGLARLAVDSAVKQAAREKKETEIKEVKEAELEKKKASEISALDVSLALKIGEGGTAFGSISAHKIAEALDKKGFKIDKKRILLKEPIKTLGEHIISIKLEHNIEAKLKLNVVKEK